MKKALILLALLLALGQSSCTTLTTNFHVVEEGRFYRSAQLDTNKLEKKIKEYNIKAVINLRAKDRQRVGMKLRRNYVSRWV